MASWTISSTHSQPGSPPSTGGRSPTPSAWSTKPACRPTSKSERAGTPAWPPSSDRRRRKESRPSWSTGSRNPETRKIDSDSTWDRWASMASAESERPISLSETEHTTMDLLTTAKNIADRVEAESAKENVPIAVTVIDIHGNVVLTHRMTGAPAFSLELAERKAYTSALVGMRTADLVPLVQPGAELYPLLAVSGGRYSAIGGGVPLTSEGRVIAGVGVSGGTTEQDIAIVEAAMSSDQTGVPTGP